MVDQEPVSNTLTSSVRVCIDPFLGVRIECKRSIGRFIDSLIDFTVDGQAAKFTNLLLKTLLWLYEPTEQVIPDLILVTAE